MTVPTGVANLWTARSDPHCSEVLTKMPAEVLNYAVDWRGILASGETTATPTVTVLPSGPTISGQAANADGFVLPNGDVLDAGNAAVWTLSGGTAGVTYTLTVTATTSMSETLSATCSLQVV